MADEALDRRDESLFGGLTHEPPSAAERMADQHFADTAAGIKPRRTGARTEREQRRQSRRYHSAADNEATPAGEAWAALPSNETNESRARNARRRTAGAPYSV